MTASKACAQLVVPAALGLLVAACSASRPSTTTATPPSSADPSATTSAAPPPAAPSAAPAPSGALPPPTPRKPGCLDSTRGAKHTFVGKLEKHPDGSGNVRVVLPKKVCFGGGRFSAGETSEIILDVEESRSRPFLAKKVKVVGTSQDFAPGKRFAYVMNLQVESLGPSK